MAFLKTDVNGWYVELGNWFYVRKWTKSYGVCMEIQIGRKLVIYWG